MAGEPDKINPYAPPAPQSSSFRDLLHEQSASARQERARRAAICMTVSCAGIIIATVLFNPSSSSAAGYSLNALAFWLILICLAIFLFGSMVWSWIQPIQK